MHYLAIDFGDKRTGLAIGDDETCIASPAGVIETSSRAYVIERIAAAAKEHGAEALVLGLPLNMDGSEGPRAKLVRQLAQAIGERTGLDVHLFDERRSSQRANERMSQTGLTHKRKKARRDALAAMVILEEFLKATDEESQATERPTD